MEQSKKIELPRPKCILTWPSQEGWMRKFQLVLAAKKEKVTYDLSAENTQPEIVFSTLK